MENNQGEPFALGSTSAMRDICESYYSLVGDTIFVGSGLFGQL